MPFTLSHPAAAALFPRLVKRDTLPLAALAIGTMAPDFEYLLRLEPMSYWSHSAVGIFSFCLPAGMVALLTWELLLRDPVRQLFALRSGPVPSSVSGPGALGWLARAVLALIVGSATHVTWDGFTHWDAWGVGMVPALAGPAAVVFGRVVPWYNMLQHASTVVGGAIVGAWLWRTTGGLAGVRAIVGTAWRRRVLGAIAVSMLAVAAWNANRSGSMRDPTRSKIVLGRVAVGALASIDWARDWRHFACSRNPTARRG
jgi:hypothetical protein